MTETANSKIKVLVVDDSNVARQLLVHLLESDSQICVIGAINDGQEAVDFVATNSPDVVLMDIHMPRLNGFEATRRIMEAHPLPIVICSATTDPKEVATTFRAMEAGAVACVRKPVASGHRDFEELTANLLQTVKLMSEVQVVRRWARTRTHSLTTPTAPPVGLKAERAAAIRFVGIGASTGGPPVLQTILAGLPKNFPVPILIVQHIARGFLSGLAEWLNQTTGLQIHIAPDGISPLPGHVYFAPDDLHMGVGNHGRIVLAREKPENGSRPSASYLFRSLALECGPSAVGVLLTGMGKDGALELKRMKDGGAVTIAQDRETSTVYGMPAEAIELGGATYVLPADRIAVTLVSIANRHVTGELNNEH
jgi:two-component system, chemotaxis family, protein-glutamate methylesterase/glutaminase